MVFRVVKSLLFTAIRERLQILKLGKAFFQVFVGFNATQEELGVTSTNYRFFKNNDIDAM